MTSFLILAFPFFVMSFLFFMAYSIGGSMLPLILFLVCLIIGVGVLVRGFSAHSKGQKVREARENQLNASIEEE